jgi:hypothetical protein
MDGTLSQSGSPDIGKPMSGFFHFQVVVPEKTTRDVADLRVLRACSGRSHLRLELQAESEQFFCTQLLV